MARDEDAAFAARVTKDAKLGDVRRNARAADLLQALLANPGKSLASAAGDESAKERFYRHSRCGEVAPDELARAGCQGVASYVAEVIEDGDEVLLIGDTTSLSYKHGVAKKLGPTSTSLGARSRGWELHSMLAVSARSKEVWGPVDLLFWTRDSTTHGKRASRNERDYEDKESFKWEASATAAAERMHLAGLGERTIQITDRESDIYEYLMYQLGEGQRFIARASWNRRVVEETGGVFGVLESQPVLGEYWLDIQQKGGRPARRARMQMRSATVTLRPPKDVESRLPRLEVNVVALSEVDAPAGNEPVRWVLLTNEPISSTEECRAVVDKYSCRWRIEEYHKFLKSEGMNVEGLRMEEPDNLLRVAVPMTFASARLMNLRDSLLTPVTRLTRIEDPATTAGVPEEPPKSAPPLPLGERLCIGVLSDFEWRTLWVIEEKTQPPSTAPTRRWAALSLARMGGFSDTKHTGRPGYKAFVAGWLRLVDRVAVVESMYLLGAITR